MLCHYNKKYLQVHAKYEEKLYCALSLKENGLSLKIMQIVEILSQKT